MKRSMFSDIFILLLALSLILTLAFSLLFFYSSANILVNNRLTQLQREAKELSYMTGNKRKSEFGTSGYDFSFPWIQRDRNRSFFSGIGSDLLSSESQIHQQYIEWKVSAIYEEYGAYTILVYAGKNSKDTVSLLYCSPDLSQDEVNDRIDFYKSNDYQTRLMNGDYVTEQTKTPEGAIFTVGVPISFNGSVYGGVFIHTSVQSIQDLYSGIIPQTIIIVFISLILSAGAAFVLARKISRPLASIADTAGKLQNGDFSARAPIEGSTEVRNLAATFNDMAIQIQHTEDSRKELIANVSHELKSPITSIQGYVDGMLDGTIDDRDKKHYLAIISDETHRLTKLITNLLTLSKIEKEDQQLHFSDFDLNELVRRVLIGCISKIEEKKHEIEVKLSEEPLPVYADADAIQQVLINLLDNAIKYTPENGNIRLSTFSEKDQVLFRIQDNGIGISPDDQPFIFDRFFMADKAHTSGKGTGLGLAICKTIMEKHGQSIRLVSGIGGCTFEITLSRGAAKGGYHDHSGECQD